MRTAAPTPYTLEVIEIYRKVIVSGNIYEVYTYERPPKNIESYDDGYEERFKDVQDDLRVDRKVERRLQTVRDARNTSRRLTLMNFGSDDKFFTLTYKENMTCLDKADEDFKKFIKRFKYHYGISSLKYIAVRERQKRGAIHFHMICDWNRDLGTENEIRSLERHVGENVWKHGFVDVKPIGHVDNVGAYLIKYMTKDISIELFEGKKMYLCSRGLERPKVYSGEEAEMLIKYYNLDNKKEVFTNCYESEYLGQITYKEYNAKRST